MSSFDEAALTSWSTFAHSRTAIIHVVQKDVETVHSWEVPLPLAKRLCHLGRAYGLHYTSMLEPESAPEFYGEQALSLGDELRFLGNMVADVAVERAIEAVLKAVALVERNHSLGIRVSVPQEDVGK